jgi:hypothetical protein
MTIAHGAPNLDGHGHISTIERVFTEGPEIPSGRLLDRRSARRLRAMPLLSTFNPLSIQLRRA